jgi:calcineurin-like phosphoesterase family protein
MNRTRLSFIAGCFLVLTLVSSCDFQSLKILDGGIDTNTFIMEETAETPTSFSFLITTDHHFTRKDSGVWYAQEEFFSWLEEYQTETVGNTANHLGLMVCLGDCTENATEEEFIQYKEFLDKVGEKGITMSHSVKGNHDIRSDVDSGLYWDIYVKEPLYQAFSYQGVSFYLLDTSARTLGRTQLAQLKEAIAQDTSPKLFCTHVPLYGKPELIYFCLPDTQEREEILELMSKNSVGLYLSGHHHNGDITYRYTSSMAEFIAGAYNGRTSLFETTLPRWYVCTYEAPGSTLTITRYQVNKETRSIETDSMGTFNLPI